MKNVAIYSRKSLFTGKGDSTKNQIELCKNYLALHYPNEEFCFCVYEDEGFSGSNIDRPNFQRLLSDAKKEAFNILICYRLDRISRNVSHFSSTLEILNTYNIDFISIKEQFDTTTPMGRAMMYISSVFAQFERETIAERVRDNLLELAKSGRWLGGKTPLGFKSEKIIYLDENLKERSFIALSPLPSEIKIVKLIFSKYIETSSMNKVSKFLKENNILGKLNGKINPTQISKILTSPVYVKSSFKTHSYFKKLGIKTYGEPNGNGYTTYNKKNGDISEYIFSVSTHAGIIKAKDWLLVRDIIEKNSKKDFKRLGTSTSTGLLSGILKCCVCGSNMILTNGSKLKNEKVHKYYICSNKKHNGKASCSNLSINTETLDNTVLDNLWFYEEELFKTALANLLNYKIKKSTGLNKDKHLEFKSMTLDRDKIPFKQLSIKEKRLIIQTVVSSAVWNGQAMTIILNTS